MPADTGTIAKPVAAQAVAVCDVWSALHDAQAEFESIGKTAKGARSKYAPLDEVLDTLGPVIRKHGLTSTALPYVAGDLMMLKRVLHHAASHTSIELDYPVALTAKPPQEIGSALTYARRYSLLSICDVHPSDEDDDGEKAGKVNAAGRPAPAPINASEAKKQDVWPRLMKVLAIVENDDDLLAFRQANAAKIGAMPDPWQVQLEEAIEKHMEQIAADREISRGLREHV